MDPNVKSFLSTLVVIVFYLLVFMIVLPPLSDVLDRPLGRSLYTLLVVVGVALGFRLRFLAKKI